MKTWSVPKGYSVVTAYALTCGGPGWGNAPIWVILRDGNGSLHEHCIQPDEQSAEMATLYAVSEAAHLSMVSAVSKKEKRHG